MTRLVRPGAMITVAAGAVLLGLGALAPAAQAQANCDWYARTALKQQQDNERLKCGFKGDAWTPDLQAHRAWCAAVSPEEWKRQAQKRDQDLSACAAKK